MLILTGRFQPFHNGHLNLLNYIVNNYPNEKVFIAIVKDYPRDVERSEFDKIVDEQFVNNKNPFNCSLTMMMLMKIISKRKYKNVYITFMPKASEEIWYIIKSFFDGERQWVIPKVNDDPNDWENIKANFYSRMEDKVIRVSVKKNINATDIRKSIKEGDWKYVKKYVPKDVYNILRSLK